MVHLLRQYESTSHVLNFVVFLLSLYGAGFIGALFHINNCFNLHLFAELFYSLFFFRFILSFTHLSPFQFFILSPSP